MLQTQMEPGTESLSRVTDMSVREFYAGIALWGLASAMGNNDPRGNKTNIWKPEHVADKAVQLADEMVRRLERAPK